MRSGVFAFKASTGDESGRKDTDVSQSFRAGFCRKSGTEAWVEDRHNFEKFPGNDGDESSDGDNLDEEVNAETFWCSVLETLRNNERLPGVWPTASLRFFVWWGENNNWNKEALHIKTDPRNYSAGKTDRVWKFFGVIFTGSKHCQ